MDDKDRREAAKAFVTSGVNLLRKVVSYEMDLRSSDKCYFPIYDRSDAPGAVVRQCLDREDEIQQAIDETSTALHQLIDAWSTDA